ncbi:hypothetical protein GUITHDRAFT_145528 [Guillardia theta CCMP2712]|uniref:Uncharacterized protein n=1 Tax=Guillardia theta (strain CCMP2712) TaxID=905079 RepID=L1IL08_GUITC|nr:hypothetical protein GUITHDRAFT_145528 [Guillardia theta CCMP2712]EKX36792.1 hypothetical protein GUITHDRAFT_145528 [Guillardia theta CCMP2712]|eukprot:XP_005823772.1 hypothetical protein GUITHDRAFT_145528 [Guillardia theta CCMP2712]
MARTRSMSAIAAAANQEEFRPDEASKGLDGGKRQLSRMEAGRQSPPPSGSNPELKQTYIILTCVLALVALMAFIFFTLPPLSTVESRDNKFIWHPTKGSGTTMNVLAGCLFKDVIPHGEYLVALPYALGIPTDLIIATGGLSMSWQDDDGIRQPILLSLIHEGLPMIPAWFLNISLPLVPIPVWQFAGATLIGALPASLLAVETGAALSRLEAGEDLLKPSARRLSVKLMDLDAPDAALKVSR